MLKGLVCYVECRRHEDYSTYCNFYIHICSRSKSYAEVLKKLSTFIWKDYNRFQASKETFWKSQRVIQITFGKQTVNG